MTVAINPKGFQITDAAAASQGVTSFTVSVGTATGGPYTASSASVALSALTLSSGVYSGTWGQLAFSPALSPFVTYFAVVDAVNAIGGSGNSPEASFSIEVAPSAPTSFTIA